VAPQVGNAAQLASDWNTRTFNASGWKPAGNGIGYDCNYFSDVGASIPTPLRKMFARQYARSAIRTLRVLEVGCATGNTLSYFKHAGAPDDIQRAALYEAGPYSGMAQRIQQGFSACVPADADVQAVADAMVQVVAMPNGKRPFRVHIDPAQDGAEIVNAVADHVREAFLRRIGLAEVLRPVSEAVRATRALVRTL